MKVLGIDPGSLITGYGVVEKGKGGSLLCLSGGRVRLDPSAPFPERLLAISEKITSVIREFRPEAVSVESIFFAKNARSAIILGHVRGVVLLSAAASRVPVFEYDPRTIKLSVTGYGAATKDQMQKMVKALLKTSEEPASDTADALAAAICHIHSYRGVGGSNRKWAVG
ncbi:MAG: crossover junction endodeoxyribonuclease RuvC [Deltaproteobacteria bacterium]|nr:crossover junction endodeoxyribonuclease RuvC [Deltaproteobacteria bacterium]